MPLLQAWRGGKVFKKSFFLQVHHCACWWSGDGDVKDRITGVVWELNETFTSSPSFSNVWEQVFLIQRMRVREFMTGKHQQITQAMSNQLLRFCKNLNWVLLWGNFYKGPHFATPDVVPRDKPCGGGPTWRDHHHPLCLPISFPRSSLQCQSSLSARWFNCLGGCAPNQICHNDCFQNNEERFLFSWLFFFFFLNLIIPQFSYPNHWIGMSDGR